MKEIIAKIRSNPLLLGGLILIMAILTLLIMTEITKQPPLNDGTRVTVRIDRAKLSATVAASTEARTKGLSGSQSLKENEAMLFVASPHEIPVFTMQGMSFPIDIIWVSQGTVSEITPNVQPQPGVATDKLTKYQPSGPADQVLETKAGWAAQHDVQPGDPVKISSL